jgi:hypothetical protein
MIRSHLSYANVMATIAVFLALGGSAYAVKKINGKDIAQRSIPAGKLKRDALTREEIGPRAIGRSELSRSLRSALRPDEEPEFPGPEPFPGEPGPPGEPGEPGAPGTACDPAGLRLCPDDELPAGARIRLTIAGTEIPVDPAYRAGCAGAPPVCTVLVRGDLPVPPGLEAWDAPRDVQLVVERPAGTVVAQLAGRPPAERRRSARKPARNFPHCLTSGS